MPTTPIKIRRPSNFLPQQTCKVVNTSITQNKIPLKLALKPSQPSCLTNQSIVVLSSRSIPKDTLLESYNHTDHSLHSHLILLPSISHKLDYSNLINLSHLPTTRQDYSVFSYNNPASLEVRLDNNWQNLVNWIISQTFVDRQFFAKLGNFLTRSRLGIFRSYHIKREFNLAEQLKSINNLWTLYNQTRHSSGTSIKSTLAQKLQKLYKEGYLSTLQKLSILQFFSDFRRDIDNQNQKSNPAPSTNVPRIGLRARLGFKPKIKIQKKSQVSTSCNPDPKYFGRQFDKRWNKFIDGWFKNPINTHTQFSSSARYFLEQIYKQLMTQNNSIDSNIPKLKTIEICLDFLRVNQDIINNRFEFATHLNDLYYNLPQHNYVFRQELFNLWQALFLAYQDSVHKVAKPAVSQTNSNPNSLAAIVQESSPSGTVERASVQVW